MWSTKLNCAVSDWNDQPNSHTGEQTQMNMGTQPLLLFLRPWRTKKCTLAQSECLPVAFPNAVSVPNALPSCTFPF